MSELSEKAREIRREYKRQWNARNKDKVKAAQARYWEKRAKAAEEREALPAVQNDGILLEISGEAEA